MQKKQCEITFDDGRWYVIFGSGEISKRVSFKNWNQALDAANEWTWSQRYKGHDVDLLIYRLSEQTLARAA